MAHFKMNEADEKFLGLPQSAITVFAGTGGTETWIERARDTVVRISIRAVGIATADNGALEACIEIDGAAARGQDGPSPIETQLRVSQSVHVLVKAGKRLVFKAYPVPSNAQLLRTIVWTVDQEDHGHDAPDAPKTAPQPDTGRAD